MDVQGLDHCPVGFDDGERVVVDAELEEGEGAGVDEADAVSFVLFDG